MEAWAKTSLILCVFGFVSEFRPIEPYYTQFLVSPCKNFTEVQINQQIYPVITYTQLSLLILVFLVTDMLRYKPVILLLIISLTISTVLTVTAESIEGMQVNALFFGMFLATTVAYYTYIYAKVDRKYYQKVTSHAQVAILLGRFSSSVAGQILISSGFTDYTIHNYLSVAAVFIAMAWAFFLPSVERSIYFHTDDTAVTSHVPGLDLVDREVKPFLVSKTSTTHVFDTAAVPSLDLEKRDHEKELSSFPPSKTYTTHVFDTAVVKRPVTWSEKCVRAFKHLWDDFMYAYTNLYVLKWCFWWAVGTCGYFQIAFYMQLLWETIVNEDPGANSEMQGIVYALYTAIGAAAAFGCGWLRFNWQVLGEATMSVCALIQGAAIISAAFATNVWVAYIGFIMFNVLYHVMITIVNSEIAKHINEDSYGLIFGVNTFFSLIMQTILTVGVAGEGGLALPVRTQFLVYGGFFVVLGAIFAVTAAVALCDKKLRDQPLWLSKVSKP